MHHLSRAFACLLALTAPAVADVSGTPLIPPAFLEAQLSAVARLRAAAATEGGCTAVLVTPRTALTAAHCASDNSPRVLIFDPAGSDPQRITVRRAEPHPAYAQTTPPSVEGYSHDLSLVYLSWPVPPSIATPLPLAPLDVTTPHATYGFANIGEAEQGLRGHDPCRVQPLTQGAIASDCHVMNGQSGGALVRFTDDGPVLSAILVAQIFGSDLRSISAPIEVDTWPALAHVLDQVQ